MHSRLGLVQSRRPHPAPCRTAHPARIGWRSQPALPRPLLPLLLPHLPRRPRAAAREAAPHGRRHEARWICGREEAPQ